AFRWRRRGHQSDCQFGAEQGSPDVALWEPITGPRGVRPGGAATKQGGEPERLARAKADLLPLERVPGCVLVKLVGNEARLEESTKCSSNNQREELDVKAAKHNLSSLLNVLPSLQSPDLV
ncbi:uncharacterized protein BO96DRAFT_337727, partial [Aspergillus niger CBS 101883]